MAPGAQHPAGTLRVLQLTDPHLFAADGGELRGVVTADSLAAVIDDYLSSGWEADLALVTGDVVQDDSAAAYRRFCDALLPLGLPVHCIPGNHDIRASMREIVTQAGFGYCDTLSLRSWLLIGIDSCTEGSAGGSISAAELARLDASIRSSDAEHILVYLHHPPVLMDSFWLDKVGLENREAFIELLLRHDRVRIVLFGHAHQAWDETRDSLRIVGTPSTCRQFLPHSAKFAVDDLPPAWRQLDLHASGQLDTTVHWVDAA